MKVVKLNKKDNDKTTLKSHLQEIINQLDEHKDEQVVSVSVVAETANIGPLWACSNIEDPIKTIGSIEAVKLTILDYLS